MSDDDEDFFYTGVRHDNLVTFMDTNGKPVVTIKPDGTIIYGEGVTPDEAAKVFWDSVRMFAPLGMCPKCGFIYKP